MESQKTSKELIEEANKLLRSNGFDIFGGDRGKTNYLQINFEHRMQSGAYSKNSEKNRRGR